MPISEAAPADLLARVRRIELRTRRLVDSRYSGEYHSIFKGQGIEFAEVREYAPGDDVRAIDWNVTARLGRPYIKRYVEERELTLMFVVDVSGSQRWATRGRLKSEVIAEVVTSMAMAAVRNNDRVGSVLVSDRVEAFVAPGKGRRHTLRIVRDLLGAEPAGRETDLAAGIQYAARVMRSRGIVFVCSDFRLGDGWGRAERALTAATSRHDVVAVSVQDPADAMLPPVGLVRVVDPEAGGSRVVDTGSTDARAAAGLAAEERQRAARLFRRLHIDEITLTTDGPVAAPLIAFFARRERRRVR